MSLIKAEIITIGDEILYGQITDTNTQWISAELDKIGIKTVRKSSVGDVESEILGILHESEQRADVILITGGLGPTKDDITKKTMSNYFGMEIAIHDEALEELTAFFAKRGREVTGLNRLQAALPVGCVYIPNKLGTAPGMWFEHHGKVFISMPGVPYEMKGMMSANILPKLQAYFNTPIIYHKVVKTIGIGESLLAERIEAWEDALPENLKLAYLPSMGQVKLRLTGIGQTKTELVEQIDAELEKVMPLIQPFVYGYEQEELEEVIGKLLKEKGQTLAIAESCTGGHLSQLITRIPGCSAYYQGGVISYSNEVKHRELGVSLATLTEFGAVSEQTIIQMAEGVRNHFGTDYGLATSGIAGPDGGTPDKPVGMVWIAVASASRTITRKLQLGGFREQIIHLSALAVLNLLRKEILNEELVLV
ncbi:MAG: competence/damage-inducible protein A [Spirosomataceae bacterium]